MPILLRLATALEVNGLFELAEATPECSLTLNQLTSYFNDNLLLSVIDQESVIGFIAYRLVMDEAELDQIVISSDFQRMGFGYLAMVAWHDLLLSSNPTLKSAILEVRDGNTAATRLYHRLGYEKVGFRKNYYRIHDVTYGAILMRYWFEPDD